MTPRYIRLLPLLAWGFALLLGTASSAPAQSTTDYDDDDDGLIDITTLAQLNAMRWDRDGEGDVAAGDAANYLLAFPNRDINAATRMGCPSPSDPSESPCKGYELRTDLDFDTTGDDIADAPYANWVPIPRYAAVFKGNNHTISNLTISGNTTLTDIGLFGFLFSSFGSISGVGLKDVKINVTVPGTSYAGALVGKNNGTVRSCYATGSVTVNTMGSDIEVGGLVGSSYSGYYTDPEIAASWSSADVSATGPRSRPCRWTGGLASRRRLRKRIHNRMLCHRLSVSHRLQILTKHRYPKVCWWISGPHDSFFGTAGEYNRIIRHGSGVGAHLGLELRKRRGLGGIYPRQQHNHG